MNSGDVDFIQSKIPHRAPMLLLDRVAEVAADSIVCHKTFRGDEFFFQGHYPGQPIVPGLILCECAAQAGALLAASSAKAMAGIPVLTRVNDVRFKQIVKPGDTIEIRVQRDEALANATYFSGKIMLNGKLAASLQFVAMVAEGA
jgi:3-hydroxyacyl-[acyl-carrier-protein] dehydratase